MEFLNILGLVIAVAVLVVGAYKGLGALPLALLASLVVIVTNQLDPWPALAASPLATGGAARSFMAGYTNAYLAFFLMLASAALYARFMDVSGSAMAVGYKFIDWFGRKRVLLVSTLIVSALTYGGVSLFVVVFAVMPILFVLFKEANLPRHLTMAPLVLGSSTYTMTSLPGTPALTNLIPSQFLGTPLTAAPVMGLVAAIIIFIVGYIYMVYAEKKARANKENWEFPSHIDPSFYEIKDKSLLPHPVIAFLPMVILLATIIIGSQFINPEGLIRNATMLAVFAMLFATVLVILLNQPRLKGKSYKELVTKGLEGGISGIGGLAAVLGFGAVVSGTPAFAAIVQWVLGLDAHTYVQAAISTMVVAAVTGSSSGGLNIMYGEFAATFLAVPDLNLEVLHRISSLFAGTLDTLPHSPGIFLTFAVMGLNHKNSYVHVFFTSVVGTTLAAVIMLIVGVVAF